MTADRVADTRERLAVAEAALDELLRDPIANLRDVDVAARVVKTLSSLLLQLERAKGGALTPTQRLAAVAAKFEEGAK